MMIMGGFDIMSAHPDTSDMGRSSSRVQLQQTAVVQNVAAMLGERAWWWFFTFAFSWR